MNMPLTNSSAAPAQALSGKNVGYYIHCAVGLLIMAGFAAAPPLHPVTAVGMNVLGIFIAMIYMWSFVGILWPSLLGMIALGLSGYATMPQVLLRAFGDPVTIMVLFAMILFGAIQHYGISKYISRWFLTRKLINGRPVMFSFVFIYATYILSALSANILPALLFMWSVLYGVLEDLGYKKGDQYTTLMVIGTMFGAISGQPSKPFTGSALAITAAFEKTSQVRVEYLPYMLFGFIMATLAIAVYALLIKWVFKPDMRKIQHISAERFKKEKLPAMDLRQKILFVCLFGYMVMILAPCLLPKHIALAAFINRIGPWGVVMAFVIGLSMCKVHGKPIMDFKEIAGRYIIWDVYLLIAMAMVISAALTDGKTGINLFLTSGLSPLLGGCPALGYALILAAVSLILANVANHAVVGILLMPIIYAFSVENGANPQAMATLTAFGLHVGMLTPAASPYAAVLLANTKWVEPNQVVKYGAVIVMYSMILFLIVGVPLANFLF